jgi:hypothetical protein
MSGPQVESERKTKVRSRPQGLKILRPRRALEDDPVEVSDDGEATDAGEASDATPVNPDEELPSMTTHFILKFTRAHS